MTKAARAAISAAQKKRWAKTGKKKLTGGASFWARLTPEERSKEMRRRRRVAEGKAPARRQKKSKPRAAPSRKTLSETEKAAKQAIYVARSVARKEGKPLPPLPPKLVAA